MEITFLGHSSFKIKGKNASLVTDPFDPKMVGFKFSPTDADIVTVSHDHADHNNSEVVSGSPRIISGPGEYEIKEISVIGFPSFHDDKKGEERGKNVIYVIEVEGIRICHLGDLGGDLTDQVLEDMGDIDILMIPVGGGFTIAPGKAVEIVQAIEASIVIPMHYAEEGLDKENFKDLAPVDTFLKEIGLSVEKLPKLSIKQFEIDPETQKVVILDRK
jgi:L-ascorbate metabolism protein UlaG (beta-lactamase superfamily)